MMFLPLLSSNTERTNNTFQLFEYSKTQVNGLILLLESILWKGGYLLPLTHTHVHKHAFPFLLLPHNSFTRRWTCSNEVWSFCDATGKLPCRTLLSILVHHLWFLTAHWLMMAYMWFTLHIIVGKIKYKLHQTHLTIVKPDRQVLNNIRYITCSILSVLHTFKVC